MRFLKTISFHTNASFNSKKDDSEVNRLLLAIQQSGAQLLNVNVKLANSGAGATLVYVCEYEADKPLE